jgi:hypothetical protein
MFLLMILGGGGGPPGILFGQPSHYSILYLFGLRIGDTQLGIGGRPDAHNAVTGSEKQSRGSQSHERHEQGIFDQILPVIVDPKIT